MNWRVLVVDDEKPYCDLLARVLARDGFRTKTSQSGEGALALLMGGKVDLLITDLNMPGTNGFDLVELARRLPRPPQILVITAQKSMEGANARRLKHLHCLLKPFSLADFRAKVGLLTGRWSAPTPSSDGPLSDFA